MNPGLAQLEIWSISGAHAVANWRNVQIQIWEGPMDPGALARELETAREAFKRMRQTPLPGPLLALGIASVHAAVPDKRGRAIAAQFPAYFDYHVGVHEGPPFRVWLMRTVISAIELASHVKPDYQLVGDVTTACGKLAERSAGSVAADALEQVVRQLRSQIAAARTPERRLQNGS